MKTSKIFLSFGLATAIAATAAQYEAESATMGGDAQIVKASGASGTGYADLQSGSITFANVQAASAGKYSVKIHYKADDHKANYVAVNGSTSSTVDFAATTNWADVEAVVALKAGTNAVAINAFWGWISVDYIDVTPYQTESFNISTTLVTPNATESAQKLYSFLRENFGKKTISGIMTGDMSNYTKDADFRTHEDPKDIYNRSGKYPALVGVDFLFASGPNASTSWNVEYTEKAMSLAKDLWNRGGIPAFTWHWKDPLDKVDAFYIQAAANGGAYTDFDFSTAFTPGTTEWNTESAAYKGIIADIDHIADYFLGLQKDGVAGVFRPLHEAGGRWFWWSINSGEQFAALYRLVFDRMVKTKGVRNLIWVYNPENSTVYDWDPGSEYYDVISIDIYNNANDNSSNAGAFEKFKTASKSKKIIALTENGPIPDVNNMHADDAVWSWWMPWYGTWNGVSPSQTSNALWKSNMDDDRIITLEDMPGWGSYVPSETNTQAKSSSSTSDPVIKSSSSIAPAIGSSSSNENTQHLTKSLELAGPSKITGVFDMNGHYLGTEETLTKLPKGLYVIRALKNGRLKNLIYTK